MSKDLREFLLLWLAVFGIAVLYCYAQSMAYHDPVTWHKIFRSVIQGSPLVVLLLNRWSRLSQCGWKVLKQRAALLHHIGLLVLWEMVVTTILIVTFLFERPNALALPITILAASAVLFVGCHIGARRLLRQQEPATTSLPLFDSTTFSDTTQDPMRSVSYQQDGQPLKVTVGKLGK